MNDIQVIDEKFTRCPNCRSFSVKQTDDFTSKEKLKGLFVPIGAFTCANCQYRFVEFGKFSTTIRHIFTGEGKRKWVVVSIPLLIIALVAVFFILPGSSSGKIDNGPVIDTPPVIDNKPDDKPDDKPDIKPDIKPDAKPDDKPEDKPDDKPVDTPDAKPDDKPDDTPDAKPDDKPDDKPELKLSGVIEFKNSNRFGVNWNRVENGVKLSRLSPGPLKSAGIVIGDILSEVDGQSIPDGNYLIKIRNEIFRGQRAEAMLTVIRSGENLYFKMVKFNK